MDAQKNTLYIAGSGIKTLAHLTQECKKLINTCDKVLYLLNEPLAKEYILSKTKNSLDLNEIYFSEDSRKAVYNKITTRIITELKQCSTLGVICYGHPFFCADPFLHAAKIATNDGYNVVVFPGISAIDCMFSDLLIDPTTNGLQLYEASHLINSNKTVERLSDLIVLQVGFVNVKNHPHLESSASGFVELCHYLQSIYEPGHECYVYEASLYPSIKPRVEKIRLDKLHSCNVTTLTSIYLPAQL